MRQELVFRVEAEKDLFDIQEYYDAISAKVTKAFFEEFFTTLTFMNKIRFFSKSGTEVFTSLRFTAFHTEYIIKSPPTK